jgi:hypothetical protein
MCVQDPRALRRFRGLPNPPACADSLPLAFPRLRLSLDRVQTRAHTLRVRARSRFHMLPPPTRLPSGPPPAGACVSVAPCVALSLPVRLRCAGAGAAAHALDRAAELPALRAAQPAAQGGRLAGPLLRSEARPCVRSQPYRLCPPPATRRPGRQPGWGRGGGQLAVARGDALTAAATLTGSRLRAGSLGVPRSASPARRRAHPPRRAQCRAAGAGGRGAVRAGRLRVRAAAHEPRAQARPLRALVRARALLRPPPAGAQARALCARPPARRGVPAAGGDVVWCGPGFSRAALTLAVVPAVVVVVLLLLLCWCWCWCCACCQLPPCRRPRLARGCACRGAGRDGSKGGRGDRSA